MLTSLSLSLLLLYNLDASNEYMFVKSSWKKNWHHPTFRDVRKKIKMIWWWFPKKKCNSGSDQVTLLFRDIVWFESQKKGSTSFLMMSRVFLFMYVMLIHRNWRWCNPRWGACIMHISCWRWLHPKVNHNKNNIKKREEREKKTLEKENPHDRVSLHTKPESQRESLFMRQKECLTVKE